MSRIVHICVPEKFIPPLLRLVRENFPPGDHAFLVGGRRSNNRHGLDMGAVTACFGIFAKLRHLPRLYRAEKIFLHGLYESQFLYLLALQPWLLKKCWWIPWGNDLYQYEDQRPRLKSRFKEWIRARVIRRFGHIVTYIPGDYELAQQWYGARATFHECLCYESNTVTLRPPKPKAGNTLVIQVGNSAYCRNNHVDAIDRIAKFAAADIRVFAPLSYGPQDEAQRVAAHGRARLGEKFAAVTDFLPLEKYLEQLDAVDIGVFNQDRQQAMGNMIALLGMGKTLYLRRGTSTWELFARLGLKVFDVEQFSLQQLAEADRRRNMEIVADYFSRQKLVAQYRAIFES